MMFTPYGYNTPNGYVGFLPSHQSMFFASERDYQDYIASLQEDDSHEI